MKKRLAYTIANVINLLAQVSHVMKIYPESP